MKALKRITLIIFVFTILTGTFARERGFNSSLISFSTDIFKKLSLSEEKNVFISPISIYLALVMNYNGAYGETKKAFQKCLNSMNVSQDELNYFGKQFISSIKTLKDSVEINIANSIWIKNNYQVLNKFIKTNETNFDALIRRISMKPADSQLINQWIEQKTNNRIKDMIGSIDPLSRMILINAIYFLGNWQKTFDKDMTRDADFNLANREKITAKIMEMTDKFPYFETNDFQALQLDYKNNKLSLIIVLPKEGKKLQELLKNFTPNDYLKIVNSLREQEGNIFIPKFKFKYSKNLNSALKNMGMGIAFSTKADFRGINPAGGLFLSLVQHDAFIELNETGTEAAAATGVVDIASAPPGRKQPFVFKADRPFFFFIIENKKKLPLFIGSLYRPE